MFIGMIGNLLENKIKLVFIFWDGYVVGFEFMGRC